MRVVAVALALVTGCFQPEPYPEPDDGWTSDGEDPLYGCRTDADCDGDVCARDKQCYPARSIRALRVTWTLRGSPASVTTCPRDLDLEISFHADIDSFGYSPVACELGRFTIDKLPTSYTTVSLGAPASGGTEQPIPPAPELAFDLPY